MARKLVCGVGINDADYAVCPKILIDGKWVNDNLNFCPFYRVWYEMLRRCYSDRIKLLRPTYEGCFVESSWLIFSNFKSWMENQDWEGKVLDKDLLVENNKIYSENTCIFISEELNSFLTLRQRKRGNCLLGVSKNKTGKPYKSEGYDEFGAKVYLGSYTSEIQAHLVYLENKKYKAEWFKERSSGEKEIKGLTRIISKLQYHITNQIPLNTL